MPSRRSILVGLGGLVAGGGALIGTGAFTTVEAQRTVNVETTGDASAFLGLAPVNRDDDRDNSNASNSAATGSDENEYVSAPDGGTIAINIDGNGEGSGLNQNAITTLRSLVEVTNQGTQTVTSVNLTMSEIPSEVDSASDTFDFTVDDDGNSDSVETNSDILTGNNSIPSELGPGESVNFGLEIDLINGGNQDNDPPDLPGGGSYTLTITAETNDN